MAHRFLRSNDSRPRIGEPLHCEGLSQSWLACDVNQSRPGADWTIESYECADNALRVMTYLSGWVLCTDRGMFIKGKEAPLSRSGRVRVFKTAAAAAMAAGSAEFAKFHIGEDGKRFDGVFITDPSGAALRFAEAR